MFFPFPLHFLQSGGSLHNAIHSHFGERHYFEIPNDVCHGKMKDVGSKTQEYMLLYR